MATNPLQEFGAELLPEPSPAPPPANILAEFGAVPISAPKPQDDFAQFGATPLPELSEDEKKFQALEDEKEKYGLLNSLSPTAMKERGSAIGSKGVAEDEVNTVAKKFGVDAGLLNSIAPLIGAAPPLSELDTTAEFIKTIAGRANALVGGNILTFAGKKMLVDDPKLRDAIDYLRELGEGRMGLGEVAVSTLVPFNLLGKTVKATTLAQKAANVGKLAGIGALYGLGTSSEGEEITSAISGAAVAGALGGAAAGVAKLFKPKGKLTTDNPQLQKAVDEFAATTGDDIVEITAQAHSKIKKSDNAIRDSFLEGKPLTDSEVKVVIDEQLSPDTIEIIKNKINKEAPDTVSDAEIAAEVVKQRQDQFVKESLETRFPELKYVQTATDAKPLRASPEQVLATVRASGEQNLKNLYDEWSIGQTAINHMDKAGIKLDPNADVIGKNIVNWVTDRQYGFKVMDELYGTDLLQDFLSLNTNQHLFTAFQKSVADSTRNIFKAVKKQNLAQDAINEDGGKLFRAWDSGDLSGLNDNEKALVNLFNDHINNEKTGRKFFNTVTGDDIVPMNIPERENYGAPHRMVRPVDYRLRMDKKLAEVKAKVDLAKLTDDETLFRTMNKVPELKDLYQGIALISDRPIRNGKELLVAFNDATKRGATNPRLSRLASTSLPRKGAIPDFLREKNIFKLMQSYSESTGRLVFLRSPLQRMFEKAKVLEKAGAEKEAEFVRRFIGDNMGMRASSFARIGNEAKIQFAQSVDRALSTVIKDPERRANFVNGFRAIPEVLANLQYNIYPNVLALNPRSHLAQVTQTLFKTAPELGGAYGYQAAIKAMMRTMLNYKDLSQKVKAYGLEPSSFARQYVEDMQSGMGRVGKAYRDMTDAFMWSFGKLDSINRSMTLDIAEQIVQDVQAGNKAALTAVGKMPNSVRKRLVAEAGNSTAQVKTIARYLNSATQFNYNKASMSEAGVVLGPIFSTFTKWPLAISGDILADMRTKGVFKAMPRILEKYAAVYALAMAVDSILYSTLSGEEPQLGPDFKEVSDRSTRILGRRGFTSMAPIESLKGLLPSQQEKSLWTPPMIDVFYNGIMKPILNGDTEQLAKGGVRMMTTFAPGGYLYRTLFEDIPLMVTGEKQPTAAERLLD